MQDNSLFLFLNKICLAVHGSLHFNNITFRPILLGFFWFQSHCFALPASHNQYKTKTLQKLRSSSNSEAKRMWTSTTITETFSFTTSHQWRGMKCTLFSIRRQNAFIKCEAETGPGKEIRKGQHLKQSHNFPPNSWAIRQEHWTEWRAHKMCIADCLQCSLGLV